MGVPNPMRMFYINQFLSESLLFLKFTAELHYPVCPHCFFRIFRIAKSYCCLFRLIPTNVLRYHRLLMADGLMYENVYSRSITSIPFSLGRYIDICSFSDTLVPSCLSDPIESADRKYWQNVRNPAHCNNMTS